MQTERAELESTVQQLKKRLEKVRGRHFHRHPGRFFDEDGAMIHRDDEGAVVFEIVVELNKVWCRLEALDRAASFPLEQLPHVPKPSTRPPQPEPPRFRLPTTWEETVLLLERAASLDLAALPRSDLRDLRVILDARGLAAFQMWRFFEGNARRLRAAIQKVDADLKAHPFDVIEGGGVVDDDATDPLPPLQLIDSNEMIIRSYDD